LCITSTTSCFAPRVPDKVDQIAKLAKKYQIHHIINNAYGLQDYQTCSTIQRAVRIGNVDAIIQSCDKNFMVPVGGAIILSTNEEFIKEISANYPGRASGSFVIDMFITIMSMGKKEYRRLLEERSTLYPYLLKSLQNIAEEIGERVLITTENRISIGFTLSQFDESTISPTMLGSMLFSRNCSGIRVIVPKGSKKVGNFNIQCFGSHSNNYTTSYLTVACAIGITKEEIDTFLLRFKKTLKELQKKLVKEKNKLIKDKKNVGNG